MMIKWKEINREGGSGDAFFSPRLSSKRAASAVSLNGILSVHIYVLGGYIIAHLSLSHTRIAFSSIFFPPSLPICLLCSSPVCHPLHFYSRRSSLRTNPDRQGDN